MSDQLILSYLDSKKQSKCKNILEITNQFDKKLLSSSTHSLPWYSCEKTLFKSNMFDFVYIYHTLEKVQNPHIVLNRLNEITTCGFIETPSVLSECINRKTSTGYEINRFLIWSTEDGVLHLLPKYAFFHNLDIKVDFEEEMKTLLEKYPHYKNSYYTWNPEEPLKVVCYEHGVNFNLYTDYSTILENAIQQNIKATNKFLSHINEYNTVNKVNDSVSTSTEE